MKEKQEHLKPQLPLDDLAAIAEIERKVKRLLEDCRNSLVPFMVFDSDLAKPIKLMKIGAEQTFSVRTKYYARQAGFCREWLVEAAEDTVNATLDLAPHHFGDSPSYRNRLPEIRKELDEIMRARIDKMGERPESRENKTPGKGGRPPKAQTRDIHSRWTGMGRPHLTSAICDRIAESFFANELAGVNRGSPEHRKVRERVRQAILRCESAPAR